MLVNNVKVYGLEDSVKASKYPMSTDTEKCSAEITETVKKLGKASAGSGHDQYLTGIVVQFDLTFSLKAWTEMQRYHFIDFVSSQSTMHRVAKFEPQSQCNEYVTENTLNEINRLREQYLASQSIEDYLTLLYNLPTGFRLTARMTTNYRQLKTIYHQRKNHRLPEWRELCEWITTLPKRSELCGEEE